MLCKKLQVELHLLWLWVVTKISSWLVITTSSRGIKQQGICFGHSFLLFSHKSSQGLHSYYPGQISGPRFLMTALIWLLKRINNNPEF